MYSSQVVIDVDFSIVFSQLVPKEKETIVNLFPLNSIYTILTNKRLNHIILLTSFYRTSWKEQKQETFDRIEEKSVNIGVKNLRFYSQSWSSEDSRISTDHGVPRDDIP